jgi:multiple sugar transport system permease protein
MELRRPILSYRVGFLFLTPALLFVGVFLLLPFAWIFYLSFTNESLTGAGALNPQLVGLDNYTRH